MNITGNDDGNLLQGTAGADTIDGLGGADLIWGYKGVDLLRGGNGDDWLVGGADADWLNGGEGIDTASYYSSSKAVKVFLTNGTASGGDAAGDQLVSIENLSGSHFGDTLFGDNNNNSIWGNAGNDTIRGLDGNDKLYGNEGDDGLDGGKGGDLLDGGAGRDFADYFGSTAAITVNLQTGTGQGGHAQGDTLKSVEDVVGSDFDDKLTGNGAANYLSGGFGKDTLVGNGGKDELFGGDGNDILKGNSGADLLRGGAGDDTLTGGANADRFYVAGTDNLFNDNKDVVTDFDQAENDKIDLSDPYMFFDQAEFVGKAAFDDSNQVRFYHQNGDTFVQVTQFGDAVDFEIRLEGKIDLKADDFIF